MATRDLIGSSEDSELIQFSLQNMRKRYLAELPIFENIAHNTSGQWPALKSSYTDNGIKG